MTEAALLVNEYQKSLDNAAENYRLVSVNYRAGLATITDLLGAQTTHFKAQNELTDAKIAYLVALRRYLDLTNQ
jgi:outer membrane protein TolC